VATGPLHAPPAVQLEARAAFHVSVESPPLAIVLGEATSVTVGPKWRVRKAPLSEPSVIATALLVLAATTVV